MYLAIPRGEFVTSSAKQMAYWFNTLEEMGRELINPEDPKKWTIYRINSYERIQVHALYLEDSYESPDEAQMVMKSDAPAKIQQTQKKKLKEKKNDTTK